MRIGVAGHHEVSLSEPRVRAGEFRIACDCFLEVVESLLNAGGCPLVPEKPALQIIVIGERIVRRLRCERSGLVRPESYIEGPGNSLRDIRLELELAGEHSFIRLPPHLRPI